MRICLTVDPLIPVPPTHYGGIERAVDLLARGLTARGHDVQLFAHPGSHTAATLHPYGVPPHRSRLSRAGELLQLGSGVAALAGRVDVIHSFGRLAALAPVLPLGVPKIQSYQRAVPWTGVARALRIARGTLRFTGCSASLFNGEDGTGPRAGRWRAVFNPVDVAHYRATARVAGDAPLVFLGRVESIKGPDDAIAIARLAGRRLVIAGTQPASGDEAAFFARHVAPHVDGRQITFVGPVNDDQKNQLLGEAAALLMPIRWAEPFGIVMAEAMACGTPVIGYRRGSVPEVVRDGINGFVCDDVASAARAVEQLPSLDRLRVRADCEARFAPDVIVEAYLEAYREAGAR